MSEVFGARPQLKEELASHNGKLTHHLDRINQSRQTSSSLGVLVRS